MPAAVTMRTEILFPRKYSKEIFEKLAELENVTGKSFGDRKSSDSIGEDGAEIYVPGLVDTVLNLGLNDETVLGLSALREIKVLPMIHIEKGLSGCSARPL